MVLVRLLAGLLLLVALIALTSDVTRALQGAGVSATSVAAHWKSLSPLGLAAAQIAIAKASHALVWDQIVARVIALPAWLLFGALGMALAWIGRRRRGVDIFAN